jgi:hypothetical protein
VPVIHRMACHERAQRRRCRFCKWLILLIENGYFFGYILDHSVKQSLGTVTSRGVGIRASSTQPTNIRCQRVSKEPVAGLRLPGAHWLRALFCCTSRRSCMDRNFHKRPAEGAGTTPPSEAWLFAQTLLGKPVPSPFRAEADARARREHLEWLAEISTVREGTWDSSLHPRAPKGQPDGGQWVATGGAGGGSGGTEQSPARSPFQTISLRAPDAAAIWKGAVIAARGQGLPTGLLDWNAKNNTTIAQGAAPKFQAGTFGGAPFPSTNSIFHASPASASLASSILPRTVRL